MKEIVWYTINLDRDVVKWESVMREAISNNIEVHRVSAIDSRSIGDCDANYVATGVRAAWLSHMKAMETFLNSNLPFAVITEDDFHIEDSKRLKKIINSELIQDFDLLQLGFLLPGVDTRLKRIVADVQHCGFKFLSTVLNLPLSFDSKIKNRMRIREASRTPKGIVPYDCLPGAHCYLISRKFALNVTRLNHPQFLSIDDFYSALSKMRTFRMARVKKSLVSQLPFKSWEGERFKTYSLEE